MSTLDKDVEVELEKHPKGLLAFDLKFVKDELRAFKELAEGKLTAESLNLLERLQGVLDQLIVHPKSGTACSWATPRDAPLKTKPSNGAHQPGRSGKGHDLQAEIHFKWDIEVVGEYSRKHPYNRLVILKDSSVKVRITEGADSSTKECVAAWDFDVGNHESPGCHFHSKYHEADETRRELYSGIDIPRLPSFIFMPTDAIEFVIGELWQDECEKRATSSDFQEWYKFPKARAERLFNWYLHEIKGVIGSPWMKLKKAKPKPLLFLSSNFRP